MEIVDDRLIYSATDLVGFLECGHLTSLERAAVSGHLSPNPPMDGERKAEGG